MSGWPIKPDPQAVPLVFAVEVAALIPVLQWLNRELELCELLQEVPAWCEGELLDELRDPSRLIQSAAAIVDAKSPLGLPYRSHVTRLSPSPALASAFDAFSHQAIDQDRFADCSRLSLLRSKCCERVGRDSVPASVASVPLEGPTK